MVVFGIGSMLSMGIVSGMMSLPIRVGVGKIKNFETWVRNISGSISIVFGVYLVVVLLQELTI